MNASALPGMPSEAAELRLLVRGRVSGERRWTRLWFVTLGERFFVMAGEPDRSQWLRNVLAEPEVEVEVVGQKQAARATSANGGPDDPAVRVAFGEKYGTKYLSRWIRESHIVAIDITGGLPEAVGLTEARRRRGPGDQKRQRNASGRPTLP
jgi:hypothetical protein